MMTNNNFIQIGNLKQKSKISYINLKPIGSILTYKIISSIGVGLNQIGANNSGNYCVIFCGNPEDSKKAANDYVELYLNKFLTIKDVNIIPIVEYYYEMEPLKIIDIDKKKDIKNKNFILEIVDYSNVKIKSRIKGDSNFLSIQLKYILEELSNNYRVIIYRKEKKICQKNS